MVIIIIFFSIDADFCQSNLYEYSIRMRDKCTQGQPDNNRNWTDNYKTQKETRQKSFILIFQTNPANRLASIHGASCIITLRTHSLSSRISPENNSQTNRQVGVRHRVPVIRDSPRSFRRISAKRLASIHWASSIHVLTLRTRS
jgi:hypothetical protein